MYSIEQLKQHKKLCSDLKIAITHDDETLKMCTLKLYSAQTTTEKTTFNTQEQNGVGFNKFDAPTLTLFSLQVIEGLQPSEKLTNNVKKRIIKYIPQLIRGRKNEN